LKGPRYECGSLPPAGRTAYQAAFLWLALHSFHRSRWAAAIFLRAAADRMGLGLAVPACTLPLFAHRAFWAALIFLRAEIERLGLVAKRPPFNLPRTERVASTCLSWSTNFTLSALNWETKDAKPLKFAIAFPSGKDVSRIVQNCTATVVASLQQPCSGRRVVVRRLRRLPQTFPFAVS